MLDVPPDLLAERRRLGLDHRDEMWEGELHMVPPPNEEHQRIGAELVALLLPVAKAAGLRFQYETGVFGAPDESSFRVPDLVLYDDRVRSDRGVEGAARLVVEIRSPGDETFQKQPFWERVGVAEVLVIDRDTKDIRRWVRGDAGLVEVAADDDGWHQLAALDVSVRGGGGTLIVRVGNHETPI